MATYSFADVSCTIVGPGGSINLGAGAAVAEEGISVSMTEDKNVMTTGADGYPMHSLRAGKSGRIVVRLQKVSPTNKKLSQMYAIQTATSGAHGLNVVTINNPISGDRVTASLVAFTRMPDVNYAKDADLIEWAFDAGTIDTSLGGGILENMATAAAGVI